MQTELNAIKQNSSGQVRLFEPKAPQFFWRDVLEEFPFQVRFGTSLREACFVAFGDRLS